MIVTLHQSFDDLIGDDWIQYVPAIENLITAHIQGWHILVLTRPVLMSLTALSVLSARHKTVLDVFIGEKLATLTGQAAAVTRKIVCLPSEGLVENNETDVFLPLSNFEDLENCFRSILVVENADADGGFYVRLAQILSSCGPMALPLAFDFANGGGSTTAAEVKRLVKRARPVLVLVDSDRSHPADHEGDTARQVRSIFATAAILPIHKLMVTSVRAVENFIPPKLGIDVLAGKPQSMEVCAALATLDQLETEQGIDAINSVISYINIKKGVKIGAFRKVSEEFKQSVNSLCHLLGISVDTPAHNYNSRDDEVIVPGIHTKFLTLFLAALEKAEFSCGCKDAFEKSRFASQFREIIDEIVSYGMSVGRIPVSIPTAA